MDVFIGIFQNSGNGYFIKRLQDACFCFRFSFAVDYISTQMKSLFLGFYWIIFFGVIQESESD